MPLDDYLVGLAFFAGTMAAVLVAAGLLVRQRLAHLSGAAAALAFATLATAGVVVVHLLPGLVGLLSRVSALLCALAALAAVALSTRRGLEGPSSGSPPPQPPSGLVSWALAAASLSVLAAASAAALWAGSVAPSTDVDTLTFHLPNVARWIQTGTFWRIDQFSPLLANGNYPHNGDVVAMSTVLPWRNDAFVRLSMMPFLAVAGLSVYATATRLGAARASSCLLAATFASLPALSVAVHEGAKTDAVMLATFGAGLFFLVVHLQEGRRSDLVLAGMGLGLAFGTKWYAVPGVALVVLAWLGAGYLARRPGRRLALDCTLIVGLVAAFGGFWLLRNWVESGNPVFPSQVAPLGLTIFDAPTDFVRRCAGFTVAGYLDEPGVWRDYILPAYRDAFGLPGVLLAGGWALAVLAGARSLARRRLPRRGTPAGAPVVVLVAALLALSYSLTPYSAFGAEGVPVLVGSNTRWVLPAFLAAAAAAAWAVSRLRARTVVEVLAFVAVLDGVRRGFTDSFGHVLVAGIVLGAAVYAAVRLVRRPGRRARLTAAAAGALAIVVLTVAGHLRQKDFNDGRYGTGDPVISRLASVAAPGERVGLAGIWDGLSPVLPAFGPRLHTEVGYVGHFVDGQLREFERRSSFLAALRGGGFDLVVIGRGAYPADCRLPGTGREEEAWVTSAGYVKLAESDRLALYRRGF